MSVLSDQEAREWGARGMETGLSLGSKRTRRPTNAIFRPSRFAPSPRWRAPPSPRQSRCTYTCEARGIRINSRKVGWGDDTTGERDARDCELAQVARV